MKMHETLPNGVTVNGKFYRMDFDYRNVLRMLERMERQDLTPEAWAWRVLRCVMSRPRGNLLALVSETQKVLFGSAKKRDGEKLTDYDQDADLIRAAFFQAYGIDLWTEKMHWLKFTALLAGIPEGTRYSDVLSIRARPMPEPTKYNAEERANLARAKAEYAVKMSEKEQADSRQRGLLAVAQGLLSMTGGGANE